MMADEKIAREKVYPLPNIDHSTKTAFFAPQGQAISCLSIKLSEGSAKPSGEAATEVADVAEVDDAAATAAAADGDDDGNAEVGQ